MASGKQAVVLFKSGHDAASLWPAAESRLPLVHSVLLF
jgi:hypothetical protein